MLKTEMRAVLVCCLVSSLALVVTPVSGRKPGEWKCSHDGSSLNVSDRTLAVEIQPRHPVSDERLVDK